MTMNHWKKEFTPHYFRKEQSTKKKEKERHSLHRLNAWLFHNSIVVLDLTQILLQANYNFGINGSQQEIPLGNILNPQGP